MTTTKPTAVNPAWFPPAGRTASLKAGLSSYASNQYCRRPGHGNIRRPRDNKCCACIAKQSEEVSAQEAALIEKLRRSALTWARAEVRREAARKAKQEAQEKAKAEKLAIRVQAQKDRDRAKRQAKAAARAAEKAQAKAAAEAQALAQEVAHASQAATPPASTAEPAKAPLVALGGCPWE
jgi:hypothetical protein